MAVLFPGISHGQRSLAGYSPWCCKELGTRAHKHTQKAKCAPPNQSHRMLSFCFVPPPRPASSNGAPLNCPLSFPPNKTFLTPLPAFESLPNTSDGADSLANGKLCINNLCFSHVVDLHAFLHYYSINIMNHNNKMVVELNMRSMTMFPDDSDLY